MNILTTLRLGTKITRAEWTCHQREFGHPLKGRSVLPVVLMVSTIVLGWFAYSLGHDLDSGQPLPYEGLSLLVSIAFAWMVWRSSKYTRVQFEGLDSELLLTTVPARAIALGLLGFVYIRLISTLVVPTLGIAAGTVVGIRSPTVAITVIVAVAAIAALAAALGTIGRLAARLVALRLVRVRVYRDLLIVFGWIPLMVGVIVFQELSLSFAPLVAVFGMLPLAWFVDLALIGGPDFVRGSVQYAVGALGVLVFSLPVFSVGTTALARRIWESEPTNLSGTRGSHSLVSEGWLERLLGNYVSRPVLTVARARWLIERRVPRGLLSMGYALFFFSVFAFPMLLFVGANGFLLLMTVSLGLAVGIAFGSDPIGTEYRTLPMLFTAVTGRQFISGLVLSVSLIGIPLVILVTVPIGLVSVVGPIHTVLITMVGVVSCLCAATVAPAVGLGVDRYELVPTPFFFTDVPIYAEQGLKAFLRLGLIFAIVVLGSVPAFVGNAPSVFEHIAVIGVPVIIVQIGSILLTVLLVAAITRTGFRIAVQRFQDYEIR